VARRTSIEQTLDLYFKARFTLIVVVTREEERALGAIQRVCLSTNRSCFTWDAADGFQRWSGETDIVKQTQDPKNALDQIGLTLENAVFVLKDFHECWTNHVLKRKLRNVAQRLKLAKASVIVLTPSSSLPDELRDDAVLFDFPHPSLTELVQVFEQFTFSRNATSKLSDYGREKLVSAAMGLTVSQAQRVFAKALADDGIFDHKDIAIVNEEKRQTVRENEALEFFSETESVEHVGGLDVMKHWLKLRERAFTKQAREYGLPVPKGIALVGIPGTGKSLTAKMAANMWQVPLLRLDVAALYGSMMGESEERARRALRLAETIAPCIIWIDEIEKSLTHGGQDSGTSTRVFGTILTWMQEKKAPCFVVATANDIQAMPPELLRKGRFDEVFFLDLPSREERKQIFAVHIKKRRRPLQRFDFDLLANESDGYVGAEIEQAIVDAMYAAFNENMREFTTKDILASLKRQVPLSVSQRERVQELRDWLGEGRAISASSNGVAQQFETPMPLRFEP
jgi:ATP-dependent 26S proteasome regulatory subunit